MQLERGEQSLDRTRNSSPHLLWTPLPVGRARNIRRYSLVLLLLAPASAGGPSEDGWCSLGRGPVRAARCFLCACCSVCFGCAWSMCVAA